MSESARDFDRIIKRAIIVYLSGMAIAGAAYAQSVQPVECHYVNGISGTLAEWVELAIAWVASLLIAAKITRWIVRGRP